MLDSGGGGGIFVEVDAMVKTLKDMGVGTEELPDPGVLRENIGSSVGVTHDFKQELARVGGQLGNLVVTMKAELAQTQEAVRLAVADMVAMDGSLADEASGILAVLDSAVAPSAADAKPAPAGTPKASPTAVENAASHGYGT